MRQWRRSRRSARCSSWTGECDAARSVRSSGCSGVVSTVHCGAVCCCEIEISVAGL